MNPLGIVKGITSLVVTTGAGAIVGNLIKATTPAELTLSKKISIGVGGFVLSAMAGDAAAKYASDGIDTTVEQLKELKNALKNQD